MSKGRSSRTGPSANVVVYSLLAIRRAGHRSGAAWRDLDGALLVVGADQVDRVTEERPRGLGEVAALRVIARRRLDEAGVEHDLHGLVPGRLRHGADVLGRRPDERVDLVHHPVL